MLGLSLAMLLLLAVIQGLTEFLPVSSSGHLAATSLLIGENVAIPVFIAVLLHCGTLVAVLFAFRRDIFHLCHGLFQRDRTAWHYALCIALTTLITGTVGLAGRKFFESTYENLAVIGCFWLVTAIFLWKTDRIETRDLPVTLKTAAWIGVAQSVAIFPGISRSGATIIACLLLGLSRTDAVRYAFLISIPAIGGAGLLEALEVDWSSFSGDRVFGLAMAFLMSGLVGYGSILLLNRMVMRGSLRYFSYYLVGIGIAAIIGGLI